MLGGCIFRGAFFGFKCAFGALFGLGFITGLLIAHLGLRGFGVLDLSSLSFSQDSGARLLHPTRETLHRIVFCFCCAFCFFFFGGGGVTEPAGLVQRLAQDDRLGRCAQAPRRCLAGPLVGSSPLTTPAPP